MKALIVRRGNWRAASLSLLVASMFVLGMASSPAQEPATPPAAKAAKKLSGRLPPYYGEVVSKEQRERIYEIQAKYGEQLKRLREQIESLEMQQQDEVAGVLTPEQRDQVAKRTSDAKAKRSAKKEPPAAAEPVGQSG